MDRKRTSWGHVTGWYDALLSQEGTYQRDLILPNLLRLLDLKRGEKVLDLACGQGFFAREFAKSGASVTGVDISRELIELARKTSPPEITYKVSPADRLPFIKDGEIDKIVMILAAQNIEDFRSVLMECKRVLRPGGTFSMVINHPAFRIPKNSAWDWDPETGDQYRRIDRYLSEQTIKIDMHPGKTAVQKRRQPSGEIRPGASNQTLSFHRPLQSYFKHLTNQGFAVTRLEEWVSNRKSQPGPRAAAENRARKEIPLFLFMEARIIS
jgi:ubiquinone/menaquinone biosynthesis C-methylase UbiE